MIPLFNWPTLRFLLIAVAILLIKRLIFWLVKRYQRSKRAFLKAIIVGALLSATHTFAQDASPTPTAEPSPTPSSGPCTTEHCEDVLQRKAMLFTLAAILGAICYSTVARRIRV